MQKRKKEWPVDQIAGFKVYPREDDGWDHFYYVRVFRGVRSMRLFINKGNNRRGASLECLGFCSSWHRLSRITLERGRIKTDLKLGEIMLNRENLGARVVTHEMTHAALGYARAMGLSVNKLGPNAGSVSGDEEIVCYAVGDMTARAYRRLYEYGLVT